MILLKLLDKLQPGIVQWNKVEKNANNSRFKQINNCNYAIELGKQLGFSLVGVGGMDIVDGNKKLILAFTWFLIFDKL